MHKIINSKNNTLTNKKGLLISTPFLIFFIVFGCEKTKTPFSADAIQPPQGNTKIFVQEGNNPASNVLVDGIDPIGNVYTVSTDSTGTAIFDPTPFNAGTWAFQLPNQNHRCYGEDSQSVTLTNGTNSQSVTFQCGVFAGLTSIYSAQLNNGSFPITNVNILQLNTQNDCGIPWTVTYTFNGSNFNWTWGGSGLLTPGETYSVSLISGQSDPLTFLYYENTKASSANFSMSSIIGQTSSNPATF